MLLYNELPTKRKLSVKPLAFSKVWTDEDILILRGMIKFKEVESGNGSRTLHEVELLQLCENLDGCNFGTA